MTDLEPRCPACGLPLDLPLWTCGTCGVRHHTDCAGANGCAGPRCSRKRLLALPATTWPVLIAVLMFLLLAAVLRAPFTGPGAGPH